MRPAPVRERAAIVRAGIEGLMSALDRDEHAETVNWYARRYGRYAAVDAHEELSDDEFTALILAADGFTSKQIASRTNVSARTAEARLERVRDKLGAVNRIHMVVRAMRAGLL